jgi:hypothetical protein
MARHRLIPSHRADLLLPSGLLCGYSAGQFNVAQSQINSEQANS